MTNQEKPGVKKNMQLVEKNYLTVKFKGNK